MGLQVNLRRLENGAVRLHGQVPVSELDLDGIDEVVRARQPLTYDLEVQKIESGVLAQGRLELTLDCECVRCLKPFQQRLELRNWACHLALEGEDKVEITGDCVDLTPHVREDMLLEFPQHPLCKPECGGLPQSKARKKKSTGGAGQTKEIVSAWAELNKLKL
jgi:uncharacterized protein